MPRRAPRSLRILALDTSSPRGSVALLEGGDARAELHLAPETSHSQRLLGSIDFVLGACGWRLDQVDLVAVGIGPGSFTGIRIGVATAIGLAQTLDRPLAGISGFDALASIVGRRAEELTGGGLDEGRAAIGIVMDASRGQVYYAEYSGGARQARRLRAPVLCFPGELARALGRRRILLAGDGARRYERELQIGRAPGRRLVSVEPFLAAEIGRVAARRPRLWRRGAGLAAEPLYIRPPDALVKRNARP